MSDFSWDRWFDEYDENEVAPDERYGDTVTSAHTPRHVIVGVTAAFMLLASIIVCFALAS